MSFFRFATFALGLLIFGARAICQTLPADPPPPTTLEFPAEPPVANKYFSTGEEAPFGNKIKITIEEGEVLAVTENEVILNRRRARIKIESIPLEGWIASFNRIFNKPGTYDFDFSKESITKTLAIGTFKESHGTAHEGSDEHDLKMEQIQAFVRVADLSVDSLNNHPYGGNDRSDAADAGEAPPVGGSATGKIVFTNTPPNSNGSTTPGWADFSGAQGKEGYFALLELFLQAFPSGTLVRFEYPGSDPTGVTWEPQGNGGQWVLPSSGTMRIWTRHGSVTRNPASFPIGNYIPPYAELSTQQLDSVDQGDGHYIFYVESVRESTQSADQVVTVQVKLPGGNWINLDTVSFTSQSALTSPGNDSQSWNLDVSGNTGTGSRYRKISLTGFPLSDEKPTETGETDQPKEQTYIDAFDLNLNHGVSDIYVPVPGSDIVLQVRRDVTSDVTACDNQMMPFGAEINIGNVEGFVPAISRRPDKPFGYGWSSNISPSIRFEMQVSGEDNFENRNPDYAYVTDETGQTYRFLILYLPWSPQVITGGTTPIVYNKKFHFFPMPSGKNDTEVMACTLEETTNSGSSTRQFKMRRKYGTEVDFEMYFLEPGLIRAVSSSLVANSDSVTLNAWARGTKVTDRFGTEVDYSYGGRDTLIPSSISCRGKSIQITQNQTTKTVTSIRDPDGNSTQFDYEERSWSTAPVNVFLPNTAYKEQSCMLLKEVTKPGSGSPRTKYNYQIAYEWDSTPSPSPTAKLIVHVNLTNLVDPKGNAYLFNYQKDSSIEFYKEFTGEPAFADYYVPSGRPYRISSVVLPGGQGTSKFAPLGVTRFTNSGGRPGVSGNRIIRVTDATGQNWQYSFEDPVASSTEGLENLLYMGDDPRTNPLLALFPRMTVTAPNGLGTAVAEFDQGASMGLSSFQDLGMSSPITFQYADQFFLNIKLGRIYGQSPGINFTAAARHRDPTSEYNGAGTKQMTYASNANEDWRVLNSQTDEDGRYTLYVLDSKGRVTSKKSYDYEGGDLMEQVDYQYSLGSVVTEERVKKLSGGVDPSWVADLVTSNFLDGFGNVTAKTVAFGGAAGTAVTHYTYDGNGSKTSETDPLGNPTTFTYDSQNRLTTVNPPGAGQKTFVYDQNGNKTSETDENGNVTRHTYDVMNRMLTTTREMNGNNLVTTFSHNVFGKTLTETDPNGNTTTLAYDEIQRLISSRDALNRTTTFAYGANCGGLFFGKGFQPTTVTNALGYTSSTTYDAARRPTTTSAQYSLSPGIAYATTNKEYDGAGHVLTETDALGHQTQTAYDGLGRPTETTCADSTSQLFYYTTTGLLWKQTDELGRTSEFEYDGGGRKIKDIGPPVIVGSGTAVRPLTQTRYDLASNVTKTIDPLGREMDVTYDERNRKTKVESPMVPFLEGSTSGTVRPFTNYKYDNLGNITEESTTNGAVTNRTYDQASRLVSVLAPSVPQPNGTFVRPSTQTEYDRNGNVTQVTDPNGKITINSYNAVNQLVSTVDPMGITVEYEYDEVGNRTLVRDGNGNETAFTYDGLKRNTGITDPSGVAVEFTYDAVNKAARVDGMGRTTGYDYDKRNRLVAVNYTGRSNDNRTYQYDSVGNLIKVTEPGKATSSDVLYSYDALNRVVAETSGGKQHVYSYDLAGNRLTVTYGGTGRTLTSTYDAANRLATLTDAGNVATYRYDKAGNISSLTHPNSTSVISAYDKLNRKISTTGPGYTFTFKHDLAGNLVQSNEAYSNGLTNRLLKLEYDDNYRLESEEIDSGTSGIVTTTYSYDSANNRVSKSLGGSTTNYTFNENNQLTDSSGAGGTVSYTYDDDGNRITRTKGGQTDHYTYDYENRLIALDKNTTEGEGDYAYAYDYRTRRIARTETPQGGSATTTKVVFSGGTSAFEEESSATTVEYVRGSDWGGGVGGILYTVRGTTPSFTHYNSRGDVIAKLDASAVTTYKATYEAFGTRTQQEGATNDRQKANTKEEDPSGLLNEGFRYRDLEAGVFLTRDPLGFVDGPNMYAYVRQNPWTKFDPEGLMSDEEAKEHMQVVQKNFLSIEQKGPESVPAEKLSQYVKEGTFRPNAPVEIESRNLQNSAPFIDESSKGTPGGSGIPVKGTKPAVEAEQTTLGGKSQKFVKAENVAAAEGTTPRLLLTDRMPVTGPPVNVLPATGNIIVVSPGGTAVIVPMLAIGPSPVVNPAGYITGFHYSGGKGGLGLDSRVTTVRLMDPTSPKGPSPGYPGGYATYQNAGGQGVSPTTGKTVSNSDPSRHIPLK